MPWKLVEHNGSQNIPNSLHKMCLQEMMVVALIFNLTPRSVTPIILNNNKDIETWRVHSVAKNLSFKKKKIYLLLQVTWDDDVISRGN